MAIRILSPKSEYIMDYPQAIEFAVRQADINWLPHEVEVEKDLHDLKTNCTESEYHGIVSTLKLFTQYELNVGSDYWRDYVSQVFPRPDIQRMAAQFSAMELCVHAPFYNKINEVLGLDNEDFYNSYKLDPTLSSRMAWIGKRTQKRDTVYNVLKSVGVFSMIEGAILYSSFAFLKHFNSNGKNKAININAGINFSVNDETIHSMAGAWLFKTLLKEAIDDEQITQSEIDSLYEELYQTARMVLEHESIINAKIFEKGHITGITSNQLDNFTESRLDVCLENLGGIAIFKPSYNPVKKWFYKDLESSTLHDFFNSMGNDYNRNWIDARFTW